MSTKKIIEIEAQTDKATKEIEELRKEVKKLNDQVEKGNEQTKEGISGVKKATQAATGTIKKLGTTIKGLGLGLFVASMEKIKEIFSTSQPIVDLVNTAFEALGLAFQDFVQFVTQNWSKAAGPISDFFSSEAVTRIKNFAKVLTVEVITRVKNLIEGIGGLGRALVKVFKGDFQGAANEAKGALGNFKDTLIGNAEETAKVEQVFDKVTKKVKEYVKETVNAARANVDLQKSAEIARTVQQGLVDQYDRQAEALRNVRDNEQQTIADRIKANEDLKAVLDNQEEAMLKQVQLQIDAAAATYERTKNQEDYIVLLEAQQELDAVLVQVENQKYEQQRNALTLQKEVIELEESRAEGKAQRDLAEREFLAEQIEGEYLKLEALQEVARIEAEIETNRLTHKRDQYKEGTQAYVDANNELLDFQAENNRKQVELEGELQKSKTALVGQALNDLAVIFGENSKFGKGIAIVQAIRDTYAGANKALASAPPPFNFISAAATIAAGIKNVREITKQKDPQPPAGVSTGGSVAVSTPTPPAFNVIGATGTNQLAEAIAGQTQKPVKAYVVSNEVTSAQSLDRNIVSEATL